jgi:hypothetical protein
MIGLTSGGREEHSLASAEMARVDKRTGAALNKVEGRMASSFGEGRQRVGEDAARNRGYLFILLFFQTPFSGTGRIHQVKRNWRVTNDWDEGITLLVRVRAGLLL